MEIIEIPVDELFLYGNNPRRNDPAVNYVANSIREFGFKQPIVIDNNNEIVCGHTRLKAAIKLHLKTVPCVRADDLTEEQIKAYRIADNRTAEFATWDTEKLALEKRELETINFDMSLYGFAAPFKPQKPKPITQNELRDVYSHEDNIQDTYTNPVSSQEERTSVNTQPLQTVTKTTETRPDNPRQPIYSRCPKCGRIHIIG